MTHITTCMIMVTTITKKCIYVRILHWHTTTTHWPQAHDAINVVTGYILMIAYMRDVVLCYSTIITSDYSYIHAVVTIALSTGEIKWSRYICTLTTTIIIVLQSQLYVICVNGHDNYVTDTFRMKNFTMMINLRFLSCPSFIVVTFYCIPRHAPHII
jgi:hypothetical protein